MRIETERLMITEFNISMAKDVHLNSLDDDTRRFLPDEVFETEAEAKETIEFLISQYSSNDGPFVYPIFLKTGENIGYVELISIDESWEVGYHIAKGYTNQGYASEALKAFLMVVMEEKNIPSVVGICLKENVASSKVLEKCAFIKMFDGRGIYQGKNREICKYHFER